MLYMLLVTWIYPHQPPQSYQLEFSDATKCEAAKDAVYSQVVELRKVALHTAQGQAQIAGISEKLITAGVQLPEASAVCIKR